MVRWVSLILFFIFSTSLTGGVRPAGIPLEPIPAQLQVGGENDRASGDEMSPAQEQEMWEELQHNIQALRSTGAWAAPNTAQPVTFTFPLRLAPGLPDSAGFRISAFSDHDPGTGQVLDYTGGTRTYDGHRGTDIALWPFSWNKLDAGDMQVVAAAAGKIVLRADVDSTDHNCNVNSSDPWNYVALVHADGRMTIYGHMRYHSITSKVVGQTVEQGEYLGLAGSSGNSSGPHLHFEVRFGSYSNEEWIDPYAGPKSQAESLWANQPAYIDSAINKLSTHSAPPSTPYPCQPSIPNLQNRFSTPARVYFYAFYRDFQGALATQLKIYRPDGSLYKSWQYGPNDVVFNSAWNQGWVFDFTNSDPAGAWRFEAAYNNQVYETTFNLTHTDVLSAQNDFALTPINTPITIDVLGNDLWPTKEFVTITDPGSPNHGSVSIVDAKLVYTPAADFLGSDVFTYTVSTGTTSVQATVSVLVASEVYRLHLPLIRQ